ncbi:MAG: septum formation initiator family protein [Oscillospiraceae bacterium]|nr:septum formation initiator family protein [Oscillospiraceae bacterium]
MKQMKNPLKNIKVIVRPSPAVLKVLLILVIVFSMAALLTLRMVHNNLRAEIQALRDEAAALEYDNDRLDQRMEEPDSVENVMNIAREDLGMVDPDTVVIDTQ